MLPKIISALVSALAFITGAKAREEALKAEIASRDTIITDLRKALDDENADDASLEAAAAAAKVAQEAAEASLAAVESQFAEAGAKADELIAALNSDPEIPVEVGADGTVTQTN